MYELKNHKWKIFVCALLVVSGLFFVAIKKYDTATNEEVVRPEQLSLDNLKNNLRFVDLEKQLPQFGDYSTQTSSIPPKPIVNQQSHPMGMRFWTFTENMTDALKYDMAGHYLIQRCCTGNPSVFVIDGLTGQVFYELGGINYTTRTDSSMIIFEPFRMDCFTPTGDYECEYDGISGGGNPRYARWNGEEFITICEPVVKNWEIVSCK